MERATLRIMRNILNEPLIVLWSSGVWIEAGWGKTYIQALWMLCKRMYRRKTLKYLFFIKKIKIGPYESNN